MDKALYWVKEVLDMISDSAIAYTSMAKIYIAKDDIDSAKKMLDEALRVEPNHKQAQKLKQTLAIKQWSLPVILFLMIGLLSIAFVILKKRKR